MGRDELGDFYVEELEELALDPDEEPTLHHGAADPTVTGPTGRVSGLAARAPQAKTAQDLVKEAFRAQKAEEDRQAQAALEVKRRVAAEAKARVVAAQRAAEADAQEEREAIARAAEDRQAFEALARIQTQEEATP